MAHWLLKTEPSSYSFADLQGERTTRWDGIKNNAALMHLRASKKGDRVVIYHTGKEKAATGLAVISKAAYPDPKASDPKLLVVDVRADTPLAAPVTLATLKAEQAFAGSPLVREPRLSFMPLTAAQYKRILALSKSG